MSGIVILKQRFMLNSVSGFSNASNDECCFGENLTTKLCINLSSIASRIWQTSVIIFIVGLYSTSDKYLLSTSFTHLKKVLWTFNLLKKERNEIMVD